MIEIIKEIGGVLKDLPDLAIWILAGILFYKVFIVGSIFGIVKLAINKTHGVLTKPKEVIYKYKYGQHFINDRVHEEMLLLISAVRKNREQRTKSTSVEYIHSSDIAHLRELLNHDTEASK